LKRASTGALFLLSTTEVRTKNEDNTPPLPYFQELLFVFLSSHFYTIIKKNISVRVKFVMIW